MEVLYEPVAKVDFFLRLFVNLCDKRLAVGLLGVVLNCVCMYMKRYTLINGCQTSEISCFWLKNRIILHDLTWWFIIICDVLTVWF